MSSCAESAVYNRQHVVTSADVASEANIVYPEAIDNVEQEQLATHDP